jgi:hypothetical protein
MSNKNLSQKIDQLSQKLNQLKAQKLQADALERARAAAANRKAETRRKILVGAFVLDQLGSDGVSQLKIQGRRLEEWLTKSDDRMLFGLHPPASGPAPVAQAISTIAGGEG